MKNYKELLKSLPSKSVVFTIGRFNPPSSKHDLLLKIVKKLASQKKADHYVFVSDQQDKKNPLDFEKKLGYLNLFFPGTNFIKSDKSLAEIVATLSAKYKNVVIVSSDKVPEKLLKAGNVHHIPAPAADDTEIIKLASKGSYDQFKKNLPLKVRELDAKRLMNDIRFAVGLEPIKEQINLVKDDLREKYFRGEVFNEGDIVECSSVLYKIVKRGSNHLLLQNEEGVKVSKWIQDVQISERQFMENNKVILEDDQANAIGNKSAADTSRPAQKQRQMAELKAKQAKQLEDLKNRQATEVEAARAQNESKEAPVVNRNSKYNIAKSIMSLSDYRKMHGEHHGEEPGEHENNMDAQPPLDLDQKEHGHTMSVDAYGHQHRRMKVKYKVQAEETSVQKQSHEEQLKRFKDQAKHPYKGLENEDKPGKIKTEFKGDRNSVEGETVEGFKDEDIGFKHTKTAAVKEDTFQDFDYNEEDFIKLVEADLEGWSDDDILEMYEDDELEIVDEETGEYIEEIPTDFNEALLEVLSRQERIKASYRFRRNAPKRQRAEKIAIKRLSTPEVANRRARRMAVSAMKKRLLRGVKPSKVSIGQKERVERFIQQRRKIVDRLATRMVPRVKQVEKARMAGKRYNKPNNGVAF